MIKNLKPSKNQKVLKNLRDELQETKKERDEYKSEYNAERNELLMANAKIEVYKRVEKQVENAMVESHRKEIDRLVEIIRWHIKPATADIKRLANTKRFDIDNEPHFGRGTNW